VAIEQQLGGNVALDNVEHARQALARSDLAQALFHVSSALATDPGKVEWRAIADEVLKRAPDPMVFVRPDEAKADFITAATRGYVQAWKGQYADALATIADVVSVRPDCGYLAWARDWINREGVMQGLGAEALSARILPPMIAALTRCPTNCPKEDPRRANCDAAVDVLGALYNVYPNEGMLVFAIGIALRRVARFDEAIQYAAYAFQLKNDWTTCVGVANAMRDAKRVDEAAQYYRHALQLSPQEVSPLLDLGDTYVDNKRWDEAIAAYGEVLQKQPEHGWAKASSAFARFQKTNDPADRAALWELADAVPRARALLIELYGDAPYFTWLPGAGDSTAFAARDIMGQLERKPPPPTGLGVTIPLTYMEAPSALTAFHLWARARGWNNVGIAAKVDGVQDPDPRFPKAQVDFVLWAFDDKNPRPNAPPPDPRVHAAIADIARRPYCLPLWEPLARQLAAQMGPPWQQQLLCALVHPPPLPSPRSEALDWVMRCQIATAMVVAYLDPSGWGANERALRSIAFGPTDWICDAAIVAMGWVAKNDPAVRPQVESVFGQLEKLIPQQGFTCWEYPLVNTWRNLGGHSPEVQKRLDDWKKRCESQKVEFAQEKHGGLTLEQYAELAALRDAVLMKQGGGIGSAMAAMGGMGAQPELAALCQRFGIPPITSAAAARIPAWDQRINADGGLQKRFFALQQQFTLKMQGIDPNSHEGRVAQQIRSGGYDVESQKQNAAAAAQQIASGQGGDPDPVVFPGQKLAKLSDYVGLMKAMQTGDMNGALAKYGLDMGSYMQASQAWGIKLASDPTLTAKFGQMMAAR
jgi:tetratricopeptide (TPR) repeat protein